jgi:hypothetical protein
MMQQRWRDDDGDAADADSAICHALMRMPLYFFRCAATLPHYFHAAFIISFSP